MILSMLKAIGTLLSLLSCMFLMGWAMTIAQTHYGQVGVLVTLAIEMSILYGVGCAIDKGYV